MQCTWYIYLSMTVGAVLGAYFGATYVLDGPGFLLRPVCWLFGHRVWYAKSDGHYNIWECTRCTLRADELVWSKKRYRHVE